MGNDGGSIPTRRELVKEAARNLTTTQVKETQQEKLEYHWTTCPLSHQPLIPPVVSDSLGNLYNKDAILEFLLPSGDGTPGFSKSDNEEVLEGRVRSLRDVVEVKFQVEEHGFKENGTTTKWVCPITNKALGPGVKAVYLVPCGHAFMENAFREMPKDNCLQCNEPYLDENVITILPTLSADKERLVARAQHLNGQGLTHSLKKASDSGKNTKKRKKNNSTKVKDLDNVGDPLMIETSKPASNSKVFSVGIRNAGTASLTAKVLAEEEERNKRRKTGTNNNLKSLFSSGNGFAEKSKDFMTRGYSIPADAKR